MANQERTEELKRLISQIGSLRKAEKMILEVKGVAPGNSTLSKACKGLGNEYAVQSYIDDLKAGLK